MPFPWTKAFCLQSNENICACICSSIAFKLHSNDIQISDFDANFVIYALITSLMGIKSFDLLFTRRKSVIWFLVNRLNREYILCHCTCEIPDVRQFNRNRDYTIIFRHLLQIQNMLNVKCINAIVFVAVALFLDQLFSLFLHICSQAMFNTLPFFMRIYDVNILYLLPSCCLPISTTKITFRWLFVKQLMYLWWIYWCEFTIQSIYMHIQFILSIFFGFSRFTLIIRQVTLRAKSVDLKPVHTFQLWLFL